ncbi:cytochrome-c peroxidase [Histidinibacterium lentulum]|uniref:Cytochrome-c peroxidase n=1 Tax=Histidinibacterium lentulum TaxID=2480588 RepID=A0A3N2QYA5_9RHOB|nr:cytochrome c peroxidase [Histidinibacterium lentulum]ROU00181.1 cytochrome-c peroxidase [Histidinibacterium lentulum]
MRAIRLAFLGLICGWAGLASAEGAARPAGLPAPVSEADYPTADLAEAALGQLLFYDPILSGNREVSCATCHHPDFGTSDGLSLGLGDGGAGLGPDRVVDPDNPPEQRIPRNSPALFNLGAKEFTVLFHDGRIEVEPSRPSGLRTPMGTEMEQGFASLLSAQTMFPVLSADEMAGHYSENEVAQAVRQGLITGPGGAWDLLSRRVAAIPAYAEMFGTVYGLAPEEIGFTHISDAIAVFVDVEWRSHSAPFDAWLRGEAELPPLAAEGAALFYGEAGCAECHAGPFLTDHRFHAMGEVQLGPGKAARFERHARDIGRMRVTGRQEDAYAFRTPSLRNVAATAPYGHAGAYSDLGAYLAHHADPLAGLAGYDPGQAVLPDLAVEDWRIMDDDAERQAIAAAVRREAAPLDDDRIAALVAFLDTLTDPVALGGRLGIPAEVPSGLPVARP